MLKVGDPSPWGRVDWVKEIAPGIWSVSTPSHGGLWLARERCDALPPAIARVPTFIERTAGIKFPLASGRWYEEDCDAALVALAFPEVFPRDFLPVARIIGAKASPLVAAWLDGLPANHPVNCTPGAAAAPAVPAPEGFELTGSDRPADAPGQGGLF